MKDRHGVLALLILLFAILYLDRVAISVAGPRMQADLGIDPVGWGWVTGIFTLAYCIFEIPSGMLGDRIGPRRVLARIVLWWSAFTALTGAVSNFYLLLLVRFCFGAGEAGAFPNSSVVIARWFPAEQRATISGVTLMASQIGGALTPIIVLPIQMRYGWRASFYLFAGLGIAWAVVWYTWFRDSPRDAPAPPAATPHDHRFPWRVAFRSTTVWATMITVFCYAYAYNFFQTWLHTFLVKGRGVTERGLFLSVLPYVAAVGTTLTGGIVSDALVKRMGVARGRRALGLASLFFAGMCALGAMFTRDHLLTVILLALVYAGITFQQAGVFGLVLDIGRKHAGAISGLMNTAAQAGGLTGSVLYGYIVNRFGSYDAPFVPMAGLLFLAALLWLKIDASQEITAEPAVR